MWLFPENLPRRTKAYSSPPCTQSKSVLPSITTSATDLCALLTEQAGCWCSWPLQSCPSCAQYSHAPVKLQYIQSLTVVGAFTGLVLGYRTTKQHTKLLPCCSYSLYSSDATCRWLAAHSARFSWRMVPLSVLCPSCFWGMRRFEAKALLTDTDCSRTTLHSCWELCCVVLPSCTSRAQSCAQLQGCSAICTQLYTAALTGS